MVDSPYYIESRYPGFVVSFTREQAEKAEEITSSIGNFVKSKMG
ncbi:MAG: hypothetical protein UT01_C0007G0022 [Candidatus Daviesbacteria bacterium GW2011_GWA1_38_7]|nr:MAG: hypothetical protein UT01_C0007G0022 [Candidatus Daviesbacteria bacterium GW2011_GWA1_38_7]